jgi:shikimate dehydrogenase
MLTGSFSTPAADKPTVAMIEVADWHHGLAARCIDCEVTPDALGDAVRGAQAVGWAGLNCSMPNKVSVSEHLDGLGESAAINMGAVNGVVRSGEQLVGESTDGQGVLDALRTVVDPAGQAVVGCVAGGAARRSPSSWRWPGRPR